ncbi:SDR family oxidoreductase [Stigmatella sp. ncwal1]|uniref:SDR family oxidoreductase n=1 Tax=Stigmatella ashevillensis TaxID=2995309 RepID=A0ABT5DKZ8_9BACT|nr:SDR family oxidoreductase [Stigmatella ashevillena]MDC0714344.1 SDR family oxidoreductase [Stigmatella ashevillena]
MDFGLKDRRALVLGASGGLGFAIASTLVKEGAKVAICSRSEERIRAAASSMGAVQGIVADLTAPGSTRSVVEKAIAVLGGVDILVINTGGPPKGGILEVSDAQWQEGFQSLWMGAVEGIRAAVPGMKERNWGRIVLVTSSSAREPMSGLTISSGLRAGLMGLTKIVSDEVAAQGITLNAVLPGYHATDRLKQLGIAEERLSAQIPARRLGRPEELGALVAFLSSDQAAYITGQSIVADGGASRGF